MGRLELTSEEIKLLLQLLEHMPLSGTAEALRPTLTMLDQITSKLRTAAPLALATLGRPPGKTSLVPQGDDSAKQTPRPLPPTTISPNVDCPTCNPDYKPLPELPPRRQP